MKFTRLVVLVLSSSLSFTQAPTGAQKPLTQVQLQQLVAAGMDNERLAKTLRERGIDFHPSGEYFADLRKKGAQPVLLKALGEIALKIGRDPLDKDLLRELVTAGIESATLVRAVLERGIDFQPTADYLEALQSAGPREALLGAQEALLKALREASPRPLTSEQVLNLLAGGVASERVGALVKRRGIDFRPTEEFLDTLRIAGADELLLVAVREAKKPPEFGLAYTLAGHGETVSSVAFSPDGQFLATASHDKTVRLWEVSTGREVRTLTGHTEGVLCVAFSPDGRYLASGSADDTVRLWDVATGREAQTLTGRASSVFSLAFGPDARYLATGSHNQLVTLWEIPLGREVRTLTGHVNYISSLAFSPDGRYLASASRDFTLRLWEVSTGREVRTMRHKEGVTSVAFSPDGRYLASASMDKTVKLWEVETGREVRVLGGRTWEVTSIAFTPDGRYLARAGYDKAIVVCDVATGRDLQSLTGHTDTVTSIAFTSDGCYLASGSEDTTAKLWRLQD